MKTVLAFLLALFASSSFAAAVPLTPGPGVAGTASGFTTAANFTGQFSAASFNNTFSTNVGGKMVTMPATMRLAANAGQFAASAVRLNPWLLAASALAPWLMSAGWEYLNGEWKKPGETTSATPVGVCSGSGLPGTHQINGSLYNTLASCAAAIKAQLQAAYPSYDVNGYTMNGNYMVWSVYNRQYQESSTWNVGSFVPNGSFRCPDGYTLVGTSCVGAAVPLQEADYNNLGTKPLPDAAAGELASKGVPLPLEVPHIGPQDMPLGDPYVDPVTGKRYQDKARVTPRSDAKTADVQTYKQEVDEAGNPKKQEDGQTDKPPEEQTDFCKKNPDASSCKPFDEAPDSELQKKDNPFSLNPVSGFGADNASCPAPQNLFTAGGQQITWDWGKFCSFAQGIRPLIIGFAWLTAIMIVVSVGRRNG